MRPWQQILFNAAAAAAAGYTLGASCGDAYYSGPAGALVGAVLNLAGLLQPQPFNRKGS